MLGKESRSSGVGAVREMQILALPTDPQIPSTSDPMPGLCGERRLFSVIMAISKLDSHLSFLLIKHEMNVKQRKRVPVLSASAT
jgi:ABC-type branched-subunit amino acid transport system ATPase component